jgi:dephospho-CoA kinase
MGTYKHMDKLIVVAAEPSLQIRRMMKRNKLSEVEAQNDREALERRTLRTHQLILDL